MAPRVHLRRAIMAVGIVLLVAVSACGHGQSDRCGGDTRGHGLWPELERGLPASFEGKSPTRVDSGENCTSAALGSLLARGVESIRFAGATWDFGGGSAMTIAFITRPDGPLPVADVEDFYETGARSAPKTGNIDVTRPSIPGLGPAFRIDVLNDLSLQTVIVWPGTGGVNVILVATPVSPTAVRADHDALVDRAVATALSSRP